MLTLFHLGLGKVSPVLLLLGDGAGLAVTVLALVVLFLHHRVAVVGGVADSGDIGNAAKRLVDIVHLVAEGRVNGGIGKVGIEILGGVKVALGLPVIVRKQVAH